MRRDFQRPARRAAAVDALAARRQPAVARPFAGRALSPEALNGLLVQVLGFVALYALVVNYLVGMLAALVFLTASAGVLALGPRLALTGLLRVAPLFALPLLALISVQWSEAPGATARSALQVLVTAAAAAVLGERCSERTMVLALFLGLLTVCSTGIPQVPEGWQTGFPIEGSFASKNSFAIHCQFLEIFALAVAADPARSWPMRLFGGCALILSLLLVYLARSGGAAVLAGVTLAVFPALLIFGRLPVWARAGALIASGLALLAGLILAPQVTALIDWFRTDVLGKDATLTGRTELWEIADKLVAERPLLGHGYFAFWRLGNPDAEAIWRDFGVGRGGGFNFHNEFVELSVGLGRFGVGLLIVLCVGVAIAAAVRHVSRPTFHSAVALTAMISMYARAFVETGLIAPFSIVLAYWLIIASRSFDQGWRGQATSPAATGTRPAGLRGMATGPQRNASPGLSGNSPQIMRDRH